MCNYRRFYFISATLEMRSFLVTLYHKNLSYYEELVIICRNNIDIIFLPVFRRSILYSKIKSIGKFLLLKLYNAVSLLLSCQYREQLPSSVHPYNILDNNFWCYGLKWKYKKGNNSCKPPISATFNCKTKIIISQTPNSNDETSTFQIIKNLPRNDTLPNFRNAKNAFIHARTLFPPSNTHSIRKTAALTLHLSPSDPVRSARSPLESFCARIPHHLVTVQIKPRRRRAKSFHKRRIYRLGGGEELCSIAYYPRA